MTDRMVAEVVFWSLILGPAACAVVSLATGAELEAWHVSTVVSFACIPAWLKDGTGDDGRM